jgi:hypothetical protein
MKPIFLLLLLGVTGAIAAPKATPAPEPRAEGFSGFRYVRVRNIFDPTRRTDPLAEAPPRPVTSTNGRPAYIALTGTMLRPERSLAFFTGTVPDANRVIGPGETIAGYTVRSLSIAGAELDREGKAVTLPVGRQLSLEGDRAGTIQNFSPEAAPPANHSPSPPPYPPSSSQSPGLSMSGSSRGSSSERERDRDRDKDRDRRDRDRGSDDKSNSSSGKSSKSSEDILRKLMERRQKELSK